MYWLESKRGVMVVEMLVEIKIPTQMIGLHVVFSKY